MKIGLYNKITGQCGEDAAALLLKKKGYRILEQNYKNKIGEIDIIALDNDTIVFIEVKTRSDDFFGAPSEAVNQKKREKYYKVALEYLTKTSNTDSLCRFDVVEIENGKINHIDNAFSM